VGSPQVGVTLGYPSGLAGPIELETQVGGQTILLQPNIDTTTGTGAAPSGSGLPGAVSAAAGEAQPTSTAPDRQHQAKSMQPPAPATAAAEGLTHALLLHYVGS